MSGTDDRGSRQRRQGDGSDWQGYEWQVHLDEIIDCDKCSPGCRSCYYKCRGISVVCKVGIVFAIFAVTILLTALVIRFGSFGTGEYVVGNGDQIQFSDGSSQNDDNGYSRFFCSHYKLTSTSLPPKEFSSFAVMTKSLKSSERLKYTLNELLVVTYGFYVYIVHTFYPSDSLIIKGCVPTYGMDAHLYIIRGEENFKLWERNCESCYTKEIFKPCSHQEQKEVHLTFSSADIVYFYYTLDYGYPPRANLSLEFKFDRTIFEKEHVVDLCLDETSCRLSLPLHTADIVIEQPLHVNENPNRIRTECEARISIYFAFFVFVPIGIILVVGCLGLVLKKCQDDLIRDIERADRIREYNRFGTRRPSRPSSAMGGRNNRTTVYSGIPSFSSTSLSSNRALSISGTVPLVQHEQPVGSLPPDYNSINSIENNSIRTTNEPPPPTYHEVANGTVTDDQSDHEPPPPAYDDITHA